MEERIINTVEDFIKILDYKMDDTDFHICVYDENKEMNLCCGGTLRYISKDKERDGYIYLKFGTNHLWIKEDDIIDIQRNGNNFFTINMKKNKDKKIEFRIVFSRILYKFDFSNNK